MEYLKLEHFLSQARLNRFLIATNNSKSRAKKLYRANLRVSQSFYPVLNLFEIFLRNAINEQITSHFQDQNWIIHEKSGFMNNRSLRSSRYYLKNSVIKSERKIRRTGGIVTSGKIIAEQSFGFWTSLFDTHHYRLLRGTIIHCFPNKPSYVNRSIINQKLNYIREFRNRIYHNEPICFQGITVDFTEANNIRNYIYELLEWMDSDLVSYVNYFDGITGKILNANNV